MKLTVLGSGGSAQTADRACASYLLDGKIMIDVGPGSYRNLLKSGNDPLRVSALFLSHLHGDHFFDFGTLIWGMSFLQRTEQLAVFGPTGTSEMVKKMLSMANTPSSFMKFGLDVIEIKAGERFEFQGLKVMTAPGNHVIEDIAYRVDDICYTGDTAPSDSIIDLASGCSLLIHESSGLEENESLLKTVGHSSSRQAAIVASRSNSKKLLLAHLSPLISDRRNELLDQAKSEFKNIELAEDLLVLDI
jgi:ribonuclease Z